MGYSSEVEDGALLVAMEAKRLLEFSAGESQLVTYLAILRENRHKADKRNIITQGFYSDGYRFAFICITDDGFIVRSPTWDTRAEGGLSMVFSFIVSMLAQLETPMKSTPTVTPTKPGMLRDKEIHNFDGEVWSKVYKLDESLVISDVNDVNDHDITEVVELY